MPLDIFFAENVRNALLAANEASGATAACINELCNPTDAKLLAANEASGATAACINELCDPTDAKLLAMVLRAYRQGYKAALVTVALAFGLAPSIINDRCGQTVEMEARDAPVRLEMHNVR